MATSMSSAFTTADRRKRIATYGRKPSRPISNLDWTGDDAPSPERPRKQALSSNGAPEKPSGASGTDKTLKTFENARTKLGKTPATGNIFDVPTDEEMPPLPPSPQSKKPASKSALKPIKKHIVKQVAKSGPPIDEFEIPSSDDELALPKPRLGKTLQPIRKFEPARPFGNPAKKLTKPSHVERTSSDPLAPPVSRAKISQAAKGSESSERGPVQAGKRPTVKSKAALRQTDTVPSVTNIQKKANRAGAPLHKQSLAKAPLDLDIFDVPSSEEDVPVQTPRRSRPAALLSRINPPVIASTTNATTSPGSPIESDDSNTSKKRKRKTSISSTIAPPKEMEKAGKAGEPSMARRSKKYQKQDDCISPGHRLTKPTLAAPQTALKEPGINKPKRTRTQTAPHPLRAPITKGQSSPAKLHSMLVVRPLQKPSAVSTLSDITIEDDVTMYDIDDGTTRLVPAAKAAGTGSVTPRQKAIFDNLLDDSSTSNNSGMPSISRLRLTDRKPGSLLAGLTRSSSDIPKTTYSRKPRLIDTLMQAVSGSGEEEEEEGSESDEEAEEDITEIPNVSAPALYARRGKSSVSGFTSDAMDMEIEAPANSQASQNAPLLKNDTRVTYAKQRSYVEESNLEDGLLLSMDFDDFPGLGGFGSKKKKKKKKQESMSESEDDPTSQVRGIHELRKQGQSQKFQMEAQSAIDDISGKAGLGSSLRRSVMMEFCTKMADEKFIEQLLESALGSQFIGSVKSQGEVIFDFTAAAAMALILQTEPEYTVLDQIHNSSIMETLTKLLDSNADIWRIAKDRKSNLSKIGQESVAGLRRMVQDSSIWAQDKPDKVSPQLLAMKTLELLVLALRRAGSTDGLLGEDVIGKLLDIASGPCSRMKSAKATSQDVVTLHLAFSIMEAVSVSKEKQATWSNEMVGRLVAMIPVFFESGGASPIKLAVRLCMNLTNNKPKACDAFAGPGFVKPLVKSISHKFATLAGDLAEEQRSELLEGLVLSLGAMINLAEFSDQARASVVADDDELVDALANIFVEGSERAATADSIEGTQSSVTIGYLAILLGNLCLNDVVRYKVRARLPGQKLDMLVEKVREFVRYNEKVDRETTQFQGEEGRETWRIFTMRLLLVVERLEQLEG